ncbi:MAG: VOC family protein [Rhizobiaceae bacterium]|jgi:hypothetical protein
MTSSPRPLDHCVLPTADLDVARDRLTRLGFTVAPNGLHPFGTENCCVYFADGTFLEPLAVADQAKAEEAARQGNVFIARDRDWRSRHGEDGFTALVFASTDADDDHARFVRAGVSAGSQLSFSRPFVDASGKQDVASFKLAFAADQRAPDVYFFACERVNAPAVDRSALQRHANGVSRTKAIRLEAGAPRDFAALLSALTGSAGVETASGLRFPASNGDVLVERSADAARPDAGLLLTGIVFRVTSLADVAALLTEGGVEHTMQQGRIIVPPAPGQGAQFIFEEA